MTSKRLRTKGRSGNKFAAFPQICHQHQNYIALSVTAKALLHELNQQYNGHNNGDLCAAWGITKDRGLGCRNSVDKARDELERVGWIVQTRQGGRNSPNLYALTFHAIDACKGKLDAGIPTGKPLAYWKHGENPWLCSRLRKQRRTAA